MLIFHFSALLITNDGGPGHFAAMTPLPTIIFYGPETPLLYGPINDKALNLFLGLSCSPCVTAYNHRKSPCDGDNLCLKKIEPDQVLSKALEILEGWTSNTERTNIEHRTSNIECWMGKDEETDELIKIFVTSIKTAVRQAHGPERSRKALKRNKNSKQIKSRSAATSLFDVRRWTFDVRCSACSMFDLPAMPWNRCEANLTIWFIYPCLYNPSHYAWQAGVHLSNNPIWY